jgi:hypothetical protein
MLSLQKFNFMTQIISSNKLTPIKQPQVKAAKNIDPTQSSERSKIYIFFYY